MLGDYDGEKLMGMNGFSMSEFSKSFETRKGKKWFVETGAPRLIMAGKQWVTQAFRAFGSRMSPTRFSCIMKIFTCPPRRNSDCLNVD